MNFFNSKIEDHHLITEDGMKLRIPEGKYSVLEEQGYVGKEVIFGIRPEDIHNEQLVLDTMPEANVKATVTVAELLGAETMLYATLGVNEFIAKVGVNETFSPGQEVELAFNINKGHFFDKETEVVIKKYNWASKYMEAHYF